MRVWSCSSTVDLNIFFQTEDEQAVAATGVIFIILVAYFHISPLFFVLGLAFDFFVRSCNYPLTRHKALASICF